MNKIIGSVLAIAVAVGVIMGVIALIWGLWCWVVPVIFPAAPAALKAPGYWLFLGAWVLLGAVARLIFPPRPAQ